MLATACTVALGTASVPVLAAEVNAEAETVETNVSTEVEEEPAVDVDTTAPQADTEVETPSTETETDAKDAEVKGTITGYNFAGASDGVITVTDDNFSSSTSFYTNLTVNVNIENAQNSSGIFYLNTNGSDDHALMLDSNDLSTFNFMLEVPNAKEQLIEAGGTKTFSGTFVLGTEREGVSTDLDTMNYSITLKYNGGDTDNGGDNNNDKQPEIVDGNVKTDGTEDVTVYLKDGTGQYKIKSIDSITLGEIRYRVYTYGFTYDAETGALTISGDLIRDAYAKGVYFNHHSSESGNPCVVLAADYTFENGEKSGTGLGAWVIEYTGVSVSETAPVIIDSYQEFDGTKDLKFQFKNGTGNDEITAIKEVGFYNEDENGSLLSFWIANYGTSFTYDLANGEVTLFKHAVSAIVYDIEKWDAVSDTFGKAYMKVEYADGRTGTVFAREADEFAGWKTDWKVKILEKSTEAGGQHYVEIPEGQSSLSKADMEVLVNINKENDVIIKTSEGVYYSFGKGTMHLIDGKESYDLGLDLIKDFSQFAKTKGREIPFSEDEFGFYIKYNYSGELPGTAQITIPVDTKWAGQTLYYYEVMDDGTYQYTGQNAVVSEDGTYTVMQDHCSDYIALTKLLNTDNEENNQKPEDNGNGDNGNTETPDNGNNGDDTQKPDDQKPITGQAVKPANTNTNNSPKTADMTAVLPVLGTGITSLGVAIAAIFKRRK